MADDSKGKEVLLQPEAKKSKPNRMASRGTTPSVVPGEGTSKKPGKVLGTGASVMASPSVTEKILSKVILPTNKEKVDKLSLDQVVTKFFHIVGRVSIHFHPWILLL